MTVIALAGRRIDPAGSGIPRFPLHMIPDVRGRLRRRLEELSADTLVCSAACGADLLALETARDLGMRRRVVLPFDRSRFRETSVTDRPGEWGTLFDRLMDEAVAAGDLVVLQSADDAGAYAATNRVIFDEAFTLARGRPGLVAEGRVSVVAVVVWEGRSRGGKDLTENFLELARASDVPIVTILTSENGTVDRSDY
jgi:hypothetical protein